MVFRFCFPFPCLSSPPWVHTHSHITRLRGCGSTFNAPNYLGPRSSGCCITSGLAGCIFSRDMPLALSASLCMDWVTSVLLKEPIERLPSPPSSNHNTSNHCVMTPASRGEGYVQLGFGGGWGPTEDQPRWAFMPFHRLRGGHSCWVCRYFYRIWSVVKDLSAKRKC